MIMEGGGVEAAKDDVDRLRCAARSLRLGEDQAGTASTVRAFLLLEHGGPWGVQAFADAPFPDGLGPRIDAAGRRAGVRPLLIRRHRERPGPPAHPRVLLAVCGEDGGLAAVRRLERVADVVTLPLRDLVTDLGAGRTPEGWQHVPSQFLVCTHGRHDTCCAELGRPAARALAQLAPRRTWEVSHIGGDRFAANVVVVPEGLYYGRVSARRCAELVAKHADGRLVLDLLRGRSRYPFPAQAAEVALRRALAVDHDRSVTLLAVDGDGSRTVTSWGVGDGTYRVTVDATRSGPPRRLTCRTAGPSMPPAYACNTPVRTA